MKKGDYIPRKEGEIMIWGKNFIDKIAANAERWGIKATIVDELVARYDAYKDALYLANEAASQTPLNIQIKGERKKEFIAAVRNLVNGELKSRVVTDDDRLDMRLHMRDKTRAPIHASNNYPSIDIRLKGLCEIYLSLRPHEGDSRRRPYGMIGAIIAWRISDEPTMQREELTNTVLATRQSYRFYFKDEDRGRRVHFAACWESLRGERGSWSKVYSAIIP